MSWPVGQADTALERAKNPRSSPFLVLAALPLFDFLVVFFLVLVLVFLIMFLFMFMFFCVSCSCVMNFRVLLRTPELRCVGLATKTFADEEPASSSQVIK